MQNIAELEIRALGPEFAPRPTLELIRGTGESTPPKASLEEVRSRDDCMLGDVDDLARHRLPDGQYEESAISSIRQNKITRVQEGAIPYARSRVAHEWLQLGEERGGVIMDLGRTAVQTALRGSLFYQHEESRARGDVEVQHARHKQQNLRPGIAQIIIEPKMTEKDAPKQVAKKEGLDRADSIQISYLDTEQDQAMAITETILAEDVPLQAYVDMLADPDNKFGKSIVVEDPESSLSLMKTHDQLEIPLSKLTEGPISLLVEVLPYIKDPAAKEKVTEHIKEFRNSDQSALLKRAESPADRWMEFDKATDRSLQKGIANAEIKAFIDSLKHSWGSEDLEVIKQHKKADGEYEMTRMLAIVLQKAEANMILTAAAVVTGNKQVLKQIQPAVARQIFTNEMAIQEAHRQGVLRHMEQHSTNKLIASQNVRVGGGCSPMTEGNFETPEGEILAGQANKSKETTSLPDDIHGSRTFRCPKKGCLNIRRERDALLPNCQKCGADVSCKKK